MIVRNYPLNQRLRTPTGKNPNILAAIWRIQEYPPLSQRAPPTVEQSPAPLQKTGPRAQAVHRGARLYLAGNTTLCTSSGSFPTREVTFHVPTAVLNSRGLDSQSLHPWLLPNTHIYYLIMKVILRITFSNNIHNSLFSPLITLEYQLLGPVEQSSSGITFTPI